jgi:molybdopterin-dependent oxidoreductase-like protein protein
VTVTNARARARRLVFAAVLFAAPRLVAQAPAGAGLELRGLGRARSVTMQEISALPQREVTVSAHNVQGTFRGPRLIDVLWLVGAPSGDSIRGPRLADYVLVEAADGYRVVFALAELDSAFRADVPLLATQRGGAALPANEGPFRIILPGERRPARWIRQVRRITLLRAPEQQRGKP